MNKKIRQLMSIGLVASACLVPLSALAAEPGEVLPPTKRQEVLDQAKRFLAAREIAAPAADPFHSAAFAEFSAAAGRTGPGAGALVGGEIVAPRTAHDILQAIALSLKPSGNFVISGERTLIFGQKRVKAGGFITITFEGTEYTLEITAIERSNFTLRLNLEEFTRPIK
jgi:hypothetical protein